MEDLARRVVVVTGAASGIGRALVDAFGAEGCRVVLADIEEEPLAHAVSDLQEAGVEATGFVCDVTIAANNLVAPGKRAQGGSRRSGNTVH